MRLYINVIRASSLLLLAAPIWAQTALTCSSNDGRRNYCGVDTRGGVQMIQQRSGSPCQQNYSWGYDARGIWVDRGCRADFQVGVAWNRPGGGFASQTITCSSNNGRRNYCGIDTRGGVGMIRQRSGSPCQQNYSWGYDARGIWVDRGCRADFQVGGSFVRPGGVQTITCSSNNGRRNYCDARTRGGVLMLRQISGALCQQGYSWGYDDRGIWVDRGCRADFQVGRPH
jgi:Protein of unknown function (DUF3011)